MKQSALLTSLLLVAACGASGPELPPEWELGGQTRGYHDGPTVAAGTEATFVPVEALLANWSAATVPGSAASARAGAAELVAALREAGLERAGATLEAIEGGARVTLRGATRPAEAVVVAVAIDATEPGSAAGLLEGARALAQALDAGALRAPRRTLVLLFGSPAVLARELSAGDAPVALLSGERLGVAPEPGGATATLERGVDPGYYAPMPPDRTTTAPDTSGPAPAVAPHGLAILARLALVDAGIAARPWASREEQWGGARGALSELGVPTVHLTRSARTGVVEASVGAAIDDDELRRTSCALLGAGFAVADAGPSDLLRCLKSLDFERRLRVNSAFMEGADHAVIAEWEAWCTGARHWLRRLCMGLPLDGSGD